MDKSKLKSISTEQVNQNTKIIDQLSPVEIAKLIAKEDLVINKAIDKCSNEIGAAIELCANAYKNGGRVISVGAGTSGRLAVLDASEMLPTYGISDRFVGIIAGGDFALRNPVENSEDNKQQAVIDLKNNNFCKDDVLIGLSASGRTPYVISCLEYAIEIGAKSISISTSKDAQISDLATVKIEAVTGPEVITGSTRMKSGTAQKMILNMISTGTMVLNGYVYQNLMINVQPTNEKLRARAITIINSVTGINDDVLITKLLEQSNLQLPPVIVALKFDISIQKAMELLSKKSINQLIHLNELPD